MEDQRRERASTTSTSDGSGLHGWLATVDHKRVGRRYIGTALLFFLVAGIMAMLLRIQLAEPQNDFLGPHRYNQLFSMHGSMMVFLFAVPVMEAVAVYLVPLLVGARSIALPRLNAFAYWIYLFGGIMFIAACLEGSAMRAGTLAAAILFNRLAALCVAITLLGTILSMRAPGMTLRRTPLFAWSMLVAGLVAIVVMPADMRDSISLLAGGAADDVAWQRLSSNAAHPGIAFVILIPALGMVSSIVEAFSRRPVFGYPVMVLALFALGLLALGSWAQHLVAAGPAAFPPGSEAVVVGMIAIVTGAQFFCWIATLWRGKPIITVPLLFLLGFFALSAFAGITAAMLAMMPPDVRLHGSYFAVAQLHYLLLGGALFPLMGALYFWFPKFTGRMLSESFGRLQFWLLFVGLNLAFLPMVLLGLMGMPRRVYVYPGGLGWETPNMIASLGSWVIAGSVLVFAFNVFYALRAGRPAGNNPWGAATLEWAALSPPAPGNFEDVPIVGSSTPLWPLERTSPAAAATRDERDRVQPGWSEAALRAIPAASIWPLLAALALAAACVGLISSR